jgi:ATP-dependent DNA helicase RecQ
LLQYFGETNSEPCKHCDVCRNKKKEAFTYEEFEEILKEVVSILSMHPLTIKELIAQLADRDESKIVKVLQWMQEHEEIFYNEQHQICWKEGK